MEPQELTLKGEIFKQFMELFDFDLRYMLRTMKAKDLEEGTVTAKIKVIMATDVDQNAELHDTIQLKPSVSIKLGMNMSDDVPASVKMQLKFDRSGMPIVGTNQISMDEMLEEGKHGAA